MTAKCTFCNDTKTEPGIEGPCVWCETVGPETTEAVERFTIAKLRYAGGPEHDVRYVSEEHYDAKCHSADVYFGSWKRTEQERDTLQQRLTVAEDELQTFKNVYVAALGRETGLRGVLMSAERRASELEELLRDINDAPGGSQFKKSIEAALKPAAEPDRPIIHNDPKPNYKIGPIIDAMRD